MKVLQIVDGLPNSGIDKTMYNISLYIKDIDIDFLAQTNKNKNCISLNVERKGLISKLKYNRLLYKYLKNNKYDIVHINSGVFFFSLQAVIISRLCGIKKIIVHSHSINQSGMFKRLLMKLFNPLYSKLITKCLYCSNKAKYSLLTQSSINKYKDKLILLKNGIDTNKYKYNDNVRSKYRKKYKLTDKIVYGHTGRFTSEKNHEYLIDLFYEINIIQSNSVLLLIGDGKLLNNIKDKVNKLRLNDKVIFLGYKDNIDELLNCMDVFIFPSNHEGLGISCIESQANGITTYCSTNIPNEANISPYFNYFDLNDDIKDVAKRIVDNNYNTDKNKSYKYIKDNGYDIKDVAKYLESIYKSI